MQIIITAVVTFVIVSLWSKYAYVKGNKNVYVAFEALSNELNMISQDLGYKDVNDYWFQKKGSEYAERAQSNMRDTLKFLREG